MINQYTKSRLLQGCFDNDFLTKKQWYDDETEYMEEQETKKVK